MGTPINVRIKLFNPRRLAFLGVAGRQTTGNGGGAIRPRAPPFERGTVMALYQPKPEKAPKSVWVKNPVGRVVEVLESAPEVKYATDEEHKWRMATPEEIKSARVVIADKNAELLKAQARPRTRRHRRPRRRSPLQ